MRLYSAVVVSRIPRTWSACVVPSAEQSSRQISTPRGCICMYRSFSNSSLDNQSLSPIWAGLISLGRSNRRHRRRNCGCRICKVRSICKLDIFGEEFSLPARCIYDEKSFLVMSRSPSRLGGPRNKSESSSTRLKMIRRVTFLPRPTQPKEAEKSVFFWREAGKRKPKKQSHYSDLVKSSSRLNYSG